MNDKDYNEGFNAGINFVKTVIESDDFANKFYEVVNDHFNGDGVNNNTALVLSKLLITKTLGKYNI